MKCRRVWGIGNSPIDWSTGTGTDAAWLIFPGAPPAERQASEYVVERRAQIDRPV